MLHPDTSAEKVTIASTSQLNWNYVLVSEENAYNELSRFRSEALEKVRMTPFDFKSLVGASFVEVFAYKGRRLGELRAIID